MAIFANVWHDLCSVVVYHSCSSLEVRLGDDLGQVNLQAPATPARPWNGSGAAPAIPKNQAGRSWAAKAPLRSAEVRRRRVESTVEPDASETPLSVLSVFSLSATLFSFSVVPRIHITFREKKKTQIHRSTKLCSIPLTKMLWRLAWWMWESSGVDFILRCEESNHLRQAGRNEEDYSLMWKIPMEGSVCTKR